ncbi:MAG: DUF2384 domain-containing protein [Hyphomicrobiales bacterium]|nr:DUF2384 domain-containing protein [Hyphomicrobiales bacterium]
MTLRPVQAKSAPAQEADASLRMKDLLGLARAPSSRLDAHDMLVKGLPNRTLKHLFDRLAVLRNEPSFEAAMGMSQRTFQRRRDEPGRLNLDQSDRAWKLAEMLSKATRVFGSLEAAERWMASPAMGLDHRKPIDLLATSAGFEMVDIFLTRLEYGVYT